MQGNEKIGRFLTNKLVYLGDSAIQPWLLWKLNKKSYLSYRMVPLSMTSSDPNPSFKVTLQFEGEYLANMTSRGFSVLLLLRQLQYRNCC